MQLKLIVPVDWSCSLTVERLMIQNVQFNLAAQKIYKTFYFIKSIYMYLGKLNY